MRFIHHPKGTEGRKSWRIARNSPALKLGFVAYDWSKAGLRPKSQRR
jgi:hypothetical protein